MDKEIEELVRVKITAFPNELHFRFHSENKVLYELHDPNRLGIRDFIDPFGQALQDEDTALEHIFKSAETNRIAEADKRFDFSFLGMKDYANCCLKHYQVEVRYAAENLDVVFEKYGNIAKLPYRQELAASYNLVQDLYSRNADIETLKLIPWIDAHQKAADELAALLDKRTEETAHQTNLTVKDTRQEVDSYYYQITDRIDAMININGASFAEEFIKVYNAHAIEYKNRFAQHLGRIQSGKETDKEKEE
jgi:hypothetical protein